MARTAGRCVGFAVFLMMTVSCGDDSEDGRRTKRCEAVTLESTARTYADWGWTDGSDAWTGYLVDEAPLGLQSECPMGRFDPFDGTELYPASLQDDTIGGQPVRRIVPDDPTCYLSRVRVSGCGFVAVMDTWRVEVYSEETQCLVGVGEQTDATGLLDGCSRSPQLVGTFPPECDDEVIEVECEPGGPCTDPGRALHDAVQSVPGSYRGSISDGDGEVACRLDGSRLRFDLHLPAGSPCAEDRMCLELAADCIAEADLLVDGERVGTVNGLVKVSGGDSSDFDVALSTYVDLGDGWERKRRFLTREGLEEGRNLGCVGSTATWSWAHGDGGDADREICIVTIDEIQPP